MMPKMRSVQVSRPKGSFELVERDVPESMNEVFPLERTAEAYERMMSGNARFRVVLTTERQA
jgi:D-arabinose 1-dehydrogenase-like Zn-dependent alcohol dehydrogenase